MTNHPRSQRIMERAMRTFIRARYSAQEAVDLERMLDEVIDELPKLTRSTDSAAHGISSNAPSEIRFTTEKP